MEIHAQEIIKKDLADEGWSIVGPNIVDKKNRLIWPRDGALIQPCTWNKAMNWAGTLNLNLIEYGSWRLPTQDELWTLVRITRDLYNNWRNSDVISASCSTFEEWQNDLETLIGIKNLQPSYWTSTPEDGFPTYAYTRDIMSGGRQPLEKIDLHNVFPVHSMR